MQQIIHENAIEFDDKIWRHNDAIKFHNTYVQFNKYQQNLNPQIGIQFPNVVHRMSSEFIYCNNPGNTENPKDVLKDNYLKDNKTSLNHFLIIF